MGEHDETFEQMTAYIEPPNVRKLVGDLLEEASVAAARRIVDIALDTEDEFPVKLRFEAAKWLIEFRHGKSYDLSGGQTDPWEDFIKDMQSTSPNRETKPE